MRYTRLKIFDTLLGKLILADNVPESLARKIGCKTPLTRVNDQRPCEQKPSCHRMFFFFFPFALCTFYLLGASFRALCGKTNFYVRFIFKYICIYCSNLMFTHSTQKTLIIESNLI